ncbi:cytochrome P450 [Streptomyces sp. NPDC058534]|uniref:cytochrome P450 n=1 Tax=Streptomyces sp. NPDC058534 TaxID=3346541 RepID=UPI003669E1EB
MLVDAIGCPYRTTNTAVRPDPCADYLSFKGGDPVEWDEFLGVWVVTGYTAVAQLLRHPALSSAWPTQGGTALHEDAPDRGNGSRTNSVVRRWFMFNDDPRHARLRKVVAPLFTAERVDGTRSFVESTVTDLLAGVGNSLDVMSDLAIPLSSRVICHVLGLPPDVAPRLRSWTQDIDALLRADYLPQAREQGDRAVREISDAVESVLRAGSADDGTGISLLHRAFRAGEIEREDVLATASLLVHAGFETTSTFIGKAVRAAIHTGTWQQLTVPEAGMALEELLRFDTSVQQVARVAREPVSIAGRRIEAGDLVLLMLGVANRDPAVFSAPDRLEPGREIKRLLTFGLGAHYCLGARLARLEAEVALQALASRSSTLSFVAPPVSRSHNGVTVLERLDIAFA